jgi:hypothetical protein
MAPKGPVAPRDGLGEVRLNLQWICIPRKAEPKREPLNVRVHHDAFIDPKCISEYDVCCFSADPGKGGEFGHRPRHFAAMFPHEIAAASADVFRLGAEESGCLNQAFEFLLADLRKIRR